MLGKVLDAKICSNRTMFRIANFASWVASVAIRMACSAAYGGIVYVPEPATVAVKDS